ALVAASLGMSHAASAQQPSEEQVAAIRAACRSDYGAQCAGIIPGGARALACLRQHLADLSAPCQQAVNAAIAGTQPGPAAQTPSPAPAAPAPAAAAPANAATAPPASGGRAAAALARMQPTQEQLGIISEACASDMTSHCASAARGPGWELNCLRDNANALS